MSRIGYNTVTFFFFFFFFQSLLLFYGMISIRVSNAMDEIIIILDHLCRDVMICLEGIDTFTIFFFISF